MANELHDCFSPSPLHDAYRVASLLDNILPFSAVAVIAAAVCLGGRLFRIDDLRNMSHDIRSVGATLLGTQCEDTLANNLKHGGENFAF